MNSTPYAYKIAEFVADCVKRDVDPCEEWSGIRAECSPEAHTWGVTDDDGLDYFNFELHMYLLRCFDCGEEFRAKQLAMFNGIPYCGQCLIENLPEYEENNEAETTQFPMMLTLQSMGLLQL